MRGVWAGGTCQSIETSGFCPKSCKRFGVKNAHKDILSAKNEGIWAKNRGSWAKSAFCGQKANFRGQKKIQHLMPSTACTARAACWSSKMQEGSLTGGIPLCPPLVLAATWARRVGLLTVNKSRNQLPGHNIHPAGPAMAVNASLPAPPWLG